MFNNIICTAAMLAMLSGVTSTSLRAEDSKISLAEVAPEAYYQLRRYPKFYGDPNTAHGGLSERAFLFDSAGGMRDKLVDNGIYLDVSITQFFQSNVSGGADRGPVRHNGTADYWLTLDSGKAGLWSGGALFVHAESSWKADRSINADTGSLLPATYDAAMPTLNQSEDLVLPELYLVQALPKNVLLLVGKLNWAGLADTNIFANNERTQFLSTGLTNNPILGAFVPYTPLGIGTAWASPSKMHSVAVIAVQSEADARSSGFNKFNGDYTLGGQYQFSPTINGELPGNYRAIVGFNHKELPAFDIDERQLIAQIIGAVPVANKTDNYAVLINFDQYLWVKDGNLASASGLASRSKHPPVGIGLFGRAGWAPSDRNVIDQFYSFGIGGYGMLIPGRDYDQWGIGWSGTHISDDLRTAVSFLNINVDSFEHAVEMFYNFQLTPAISLTGNAQYINSANPAIDSAYTIGTRLQVDF